MIRRPPLLDTLGTMGDMGVDDTRGAYDAVAATYEDRFLDELDAKPRDRELLDELRASAIPGPILDVGCGPGQVGAHLRAGGCAVVGLDLSLPMARLAARRLDGAAVADLRALPIADGSLRAVVAFYSVIHLPRPALGAAFDAFARALRPGGRVLVSAHEGQEEASTDEFLGKPVSLRATLLELDELVAAAEGAGLAVSSAERRPPYANEGATTRLYVLAERPA